VTQRPVDPARADAPARVNAVEVRRFRFEAGLRDHLGGLLLLARLLWRELRR
jgi:hypothetical protein